MSLAVCRRAELGCTAKLSEVTGLSQAVALTRPPVVWSNLQSSLAIAIDIIRVYAIAYPGPDRCHRILGPPWIPPAPFHRDIGAPFGNLGPPLARNLCVQLTGLPSRKMRYVSAAVNKTKRTNFPTHFGGVKHIMMEKEKRQRKKGDLINYSEIYAYVKEGTCIDVH